MTPLSVVHLNTERGWRGGERQTWLLARELERRGHRNWVACRPGEPLARESQAAGLSVLPLSPWSEAGLATALRLRLFLRRQKIDVLHAHTGHAVGLGALAAVGTPVRRVATRRVDFPLRANAFTRWKYGRFHGVAAISGPIENLLRAAGVAPGRIRRIPSGIDPSSYPAAADRPRWRAERGVRPEEKVIVHAGALVPHKDQATLLRAFAEVRRRLPGTRLLILGDGPRRSALDVLAREVGVEGAVLFLGHRSDVLEYMAMADLFVFSSKEEGLGTALLDAMALGVPTAATTAGGIPDLYGGAEAPELSPPGDNAALAKNMERVLTDPAEARRRVERGRQTADRFSVRAMADAYEKFYRDLLRGTP